MYIVTSESAIVEFISYYYAVTEPSTAGNTENFDRKPVEKTAADFDNGAIIFGSQRDSRKRHHHCSMKLRSIRLASKIIALITRDKIIIRIRSDNTRFKPLPVTVL